jgi:pilus assembly protein Flp/PilA
MKATTHLCADEPGATYCDRYGLLASLIAVVIIGAVKLVGSNSSAMYTAVANNLSWLGGRPAELITEEIEAHCWPEDSQSASA